MVSSEESERCFAIRVHLKKTKHFLSPLINMERLTDCNLTRLSLLHCIPAHPFIHLVLTPSPHVLSVLTIICIKGLAACTDSPQPARLNALGNAETSINICPRSTRLYTKVTPGLWLSSTAAPLGRDRIDAKNCRC